ncbi:BNR repeat-containing protein [Arcticibacter tournemirensis]|uniref:Neuraminidase n=1 Tax=Arcticibacter tournemirensis TaxID=699437 RepID=A0A4Q0MFY5_9SPHI|nr:BNR repeat-containing protein [Arcticibacter tournemirensis]RXF72430.1 neuraminidase [Arcticibacter tournemirensis]
MRGLLCIVPLFLVLAAAQAQGLPAKVRLVDVGEAWASNSVNAVIFRRNSLVTFRDTQYIAYYDNEGYVVVGKRKSSDTSWVLKRSDYKGKVTDAHNTISLMVDGSGYLHLSWDHHSNALRYCRSVSPGSLDLTPKMPMTGMLEERVTYPEFYRMPDGNLLFLYRNGQSGQGNLVINKYDIGTQKWNQLHRNLIDGEGNRNAYWQSYVDASGTIHISWVWRESPDVASNHDMCYARSTDGGKTWKRSTGEKYVLPITEESAEYACKIPRQSELINQTSMCADEKGNPFIATYWREPGSDIPQYHVIYKEAKSWKTLSLDFRKKTFSLSGTGTKRIPISRPQVMVKGAGRRASLLMVFRDEERGSRASAVTIPSLGSGKWKIIDLSQDSLGSWEPSYDTELWKDKQHLNLFVQKVEQIDGEGKANVPPSMVKVLEWSPFKKNNHYRNKL